MKKRENFAKQGSKSKPFTIRFTNEFLEDVKKRRGLVNGQKIISFLEDLYKQAFNPIFGNPVMERNAPLKIQLHGQGEVVPPPDIFAAYVPHALAFRDKMEAAANQNKPQEAAKKGKGKQSATPKVEKPEKAVQNKLQTPPGLTGIDLAIWKRENGIK